MEKLKQYRLLKKVKKMLDAPARPEEDYDESGSSATMFIGAATPRSASHFANGAVSLRQGQVKRMADLTTGLLDLVEGNRVEGWEERLGAGLVQLDVCFQELDLGLLFTAREAEERSWRAAARRKERGPEERKGELSVADVEGMRLEIARWQKEQMERKRRLYKVETMVRDLGVNINDVRCRALESDRKRALEALKGSTDQGVRMLRDVQRRLDEMNV